MRFKNIATKKGNIEYVPGDVLVVCNEYEELLPKDYEMVEN